MHLWPNSHERRRACATMRRDLAVVVQDLLAEGKNVGRNRPHQEKPLNVFLVGVDVRQCVWNRQRIREIVFAAIGAEPWPPRVAFEELAPPVAAPEAPRCLSSPLGS